MKSFNSMYKVFFKGSSLIDKEGLNLTFFGNKEMIFKLTDFNSFVVMLEKKQNFIASTKNIQEILSLGSADKSNISNFMVLLFTIPKSKGNQYSKRIGFLIGLHNKEGYLVLGVWPYSIDEIYIDSIKINNIIMEILNNPSQFEDILLIS